MENPELSKIHELNVEIAKQRGIFKKGVESGVIDLELAELLEDNSIFDSTVSKFLDDHLNSQGVNSLYELGEVITKKRITKKAFDIIARVKSESNRDKQSAYVLELVKLAK